MVAVSALHIAIMAGAGVIAGMVNVLAGAGSLLTYPILVALGLSPLAANVTNDLGVVPGNFSGMVGVREDLRGQRALLWTLVPRSMAGSLIGAGLLLILPSHAFNCCCWPAGSRWPSRCSSAGRERRSSPAPACSIARSS
jgi:uncharacterized membrane protein YfcA